jgi:peroxiredoxin
VARRHEDVQFVGIGSGDEAAQLEAFVSRHDLAHVPQAADPSGDLRARLKVVGQPNWWFVDGETGRVAKVYGALGEQGLEQQLAKLRG